MKTKAFTLIELLVVIAIIAILAAILFPVFAQAKLAAKKTAALSNVKQLGTSIMIYMNDSDDVFPMASISGTGQPWMSSEGQRLWSSATRIGVYTKSPDLLQSPADSLKGLDKAAFAGMSADRSANLKPTSFMANAITPFTDYTRNVFGVDNPRGLMPYGTDYYNGTTSATSGTALPYPSQIVMLADGKDGMMDKIWGCGQWNQREVDYCYNPSSDISESWNIDLFTLAPASSPIYQSWRKYSGSVPFVFGDSSAKSLKPGELRDAKRWAVNAP